MTTSVPAPQSRQVFIGRGASWVAEGWRLFIDDPMMWILFFLVFILLSMVASFIPLVAFLLFPFLTAGIYGVGRSAQAGKLNMSDVFIGFRQAPRTLLALGFFHLVAVAVAAIIAGLITGISKLSVLDLNSDMAMQMQLSPEQAMIALMMMLTFLAIYFVIFMMMYFAPALVCFHYCTAGQAMRISLHACLQNILPFTLYSLISMILLGLGAALMGIGLLIAMPVLMASMFYSYHDIFDLAGKPNTASNLPDSTRKE